MTRISDKNSKSKETKNIKRRSNFNALFVFNVLLFVFALSQAICLLMLSLTVKQDLIKYKEKGSVDYKVYLNKNDFYEQDYLEKDMVYVSSLINNISTTFNYNFNVDSESNIEYDYEVVGEIIIYDNNKENVFFRKEYNLVDKVTQKTTNVKDFMINKTFNIDYGYYNSLANKFRKNYGVSSKSDFVVKFKLNYHNDDNNMKVSEQKDMTLTIPLSENEVTLKTDVSKISNGEKFVLGKKHVVVDSTRKLVSSILMALISLFLFIYIIISLFEIRLHRNKYDAFIKKSLREYDRLIVNTTTSPNLFKGKVIDVNSFQELLDVRDNLSIPIMYYVLEEHKKCVFYLNHDKEIFILKVNESDLEKSN